jgi:hypothetical protein
MNHRLIPSAKPSAVICAFLDVSLGGSLPHQQSAANNGTGFDKVPMCLSTDKGRRWKEAEVI